MPPDSDVLGDWADEPEPGDDAEREALTADIGSVLAGHTVVPAAIIWWRTRHERRADKAAASPDSSEQARPPRWFEL